MPSNEIGIGTGIDSGNVMPSLDFDPYTDIAPDY